LVVQQLPRRPWKRSAVHFEMRWLHDSRMCASAAGDDSNSVRGRFLAMLDAAAYAQLANATDRRDDYRAKGNCAHGYPVQHFVCVAEGGVSAGLANGQN
jgi:hypothetical protein